MRNARKAAIDPRRASIVADIISAAQPLSDIGFPGVYFLIRDGTVQYIGSSSCVLARLASHQGPNGLAFSPPTWGENPWAVTCLLCESVAQARVMETAWIRYLRPPLNTVAKPKSASSVYLEFPEFFPTVWDCIDIMTKRKHASWLSRVLPTKETKP